jgi:hypothetical protein
MNISDLIIKEGTPEHTAYLLSRNADEEAAAWAKMEGESFWNPARIKLVRQMRKANNKINKIKKRLFKGIL